MDRWTDRQNGLWTYGVFCWTDRQTERQMDGHKNGINICTERQTDEIAQRQTEWVIDMWGIQLDRRIDRQINISLRVLNSN